MLIFFFVVVVVAVLTRVVFIFFRNASLALLVLTLSRPCLSSHSVRLSVHFTHNSINSFCPFVPLHCACWPFALFDWRKGEKIERAKRIKKGALPFVSGDYISVFVCYVGKVQVRCM